MYVRYESSEGKKRVSYFFAVGNVEICAEYTKCESHDKIRHSGAYINVLEMLTACQFLIFCYLITPTSR